MIKFPFAAAALAGLAFSTAATVADAKDPVIANAVAPDAVAPSPERRYCVITTPTGTRIPKKTCKTRIEWQKEDGFDPLNPQG